MRVQQNILNLPVGSWTDDSSLTLCLLDSLAITKKQATGKIAGLLMKETTETEA